MEKEEYRKDARVVIKWLYEDSWDDGLLIIKK
jgi:hypothetical protein